jgi:hypothetical protein
MYSVTEHKHAGAVCRPPRSLDRFWGFCHERVGKRHKAQNKHSGAAQTASQTAKELRHNGGYLHALPEPGWVTDRNPISGPRARCRSRRYCLQSGWVTLWGARIVPLRFGADRDPAQDHYELAHPRRAETQPLPRPAPTSLPAALDQGRDHLLADEEPDIHLNAAASHRKKLASRNR